jgi:hypothetical protein
MPPLRGTVVVAEVVFQEARTMRFARILFLVAGIWGVLTLAPLYFIFGRIGQMDPPPITHPAFFYGFVGAGLAWQFAFFVISSDPARYHLLMLPSIFEKFSYGIAVAVLVHQGRMHRNDMLFGGVDLLLGLLFVLAYFKTPRFAGHP